jgi:hypothetical protein
VPAIRPAKARPVQGRRIGLSLALFAYCAVGFWLLAANWTLLGLRPLAGDHRSYIYSVRLLAFGLIILGVVHRTARDPSSRTARSAHENTTRSTR